MEVQAYSVIGRARLGTQVCPQIAKPSHLPLCWTSGKRYKSILIELAMPVAVVLKTEGPQAPTLSCLLEMWWGRDRGSAETASLLITWLALKGSVKIGQLCWHFSCESCGLSCESCPWASGSVASDHFIFTQRLWRGGKVGFALSWLCRVPGVSWCLSPLHAARGSLKEPRLADEATWPTPRSHSALPRAAPLLRFYGRQHLKSFSAEETFENHKPAGRRHSAMVKTIALELDNTRSNPGPTTPGLCTSQSESFHPFWTSNIYSGAELTQEMLVMYTTVWSHKWVRN